MIISKRINVHFLDNFIEYVENEIKVETVKANNLVVEKYLVYLFDHLIKVDMKDSENLENLMPWSHEIPKNMKIKEKKQI